MGGTILRIYTDGACSGNQNEKNVGGWGAILEYGTAVRELKGGEKNTTNNRMEMTALLSALQALKRPGLTVHVFADSSYLLNCFKQKWYVKWQKNGWQTSSKTPVENRELWEQLLPFLDEHDFHFYKVKGHVNPEGTPQSLQKVYKDFLKNNGDSFTWEDFIHATTMNNRADKLANLAMDELR